MTTPSAPQEGSEYGPQADLDHDLAVRRWRMVLGRYAQSALPRHPEDAGLDGTLGYLYDREYTERGHRLSDSGAANRDGVGRGGGLDASALRAVDWLDGARRLFPASTIERLERDALTRYGLSDLLADPDAVDSIRTSPELGAALLRIKGTISPALADGLRMLIARIVTDILQRLRRPMTTALTGARQRHRRSHCGGARRRPPTNSAVSGGEVSLSLGRTSDRKHCHILPRNLFLRFRRSPAVHCARRRTAGRPPDK